MYEPAEDSLFFAEFLRDKFRKNIKYLDMGAGSGVLSETAKECNVNEILAVDIDPECVKFVKKKGFDVIQGDLFSNVNGKFDLISFNAPYLPEDKFDYRRDTTGGKKGDETAVRFLKDCLKFLKKDGKAYLLVSSLTPLNRIEKFGAKIVARKKLFFEELLVYGFWK